METGSLVRHAVMFGPLFVIGSASAAELIVAVASAAHGWWVFFLASNFLLVLFLQHCMAERELEETMLVEVMDKQNLALADALRLADVLRGMVAKQR